jgi:hypothetical protein
MKTIPYSFQRVARAIRTLMIVAVLIPAACLPSQAQTEPTAKGFDAFRGMRTRNIFDPDRRGARAETAPSTRTESRSNFLQLTGTMVAGDKVLAFFSGSHSDFNKVVGVRDKVGNYTVLAINNVQVELEGAGSKLNLPVGKQLSLDGTPVVTSALPISPGIGSSPSSAPSSTEPPAGVPADKADVLRRMMERRQQEVTK